MGWGLGSLLSEMKLPEIVAAYSGEVDSSGLLFMGSPEVCMNRYLCGTN